MDPTDLEILRRLEKLKEPLGQIPSEEELRMRLSALKNEATRDVKNKYVLIPKSKTDVEQVEDLMRQYSAEVTLPSVSGTRSQDIEEIERRLKNLKPDTSSIPSFHDQETGCENKRFLKKILAEAALEKRTADQFPHLVSSSDSAQMKLFDDPIQDEYEFCYICDRSPQWICFFCDNNVFCTKCFKEYHEEIGEYHDRKKINRPPKPHSDSDYSD